MINTTDTFSVRPAPDGHGFDVVSAERGPFAVCPTREEAESLCRGCTARVESNRRAAARAARATLVTDGGRSLLEELLDPNAVVHADLMQKRLRELGFRDGWLRPEELHKPTAEAQVVDGHVDDDAHVTLTLRYLSSDDVARVLRALGILGDVDECARCGAWPHGETPCEPHEVHT